MTIVEAALGNRRVTPAVPEGRTPATTRAGRQSRSSQRDESSSWSAFLRYVDATGAESERRFTCRRIIGTGEAYSVIGFCHERKAVRTFVISQIQEMVCCETGEVLDPGEHFAMLRESGALAVEDKVLTDVVRIMSFIARCDDSYHPLERSAIETIIERYCVRFGGTDGMYRSAIAGHGRVAPDATDVVKSLKRITWADHAPAVARFVLDSGGAVIDADGQHHDIEIDWAIEISNSLKRIAVR